MTSFLFLHFPHPPSPFSPRDNGTVLLTHVMSPPLVDDFVRTLNECNNICAPPLISYRDRFHARIRVTLSPPSLMKPTTTALHIFLFFFSKEILADLAIDIVRRPVRIEPPHFP